MLKFIKWFFIVFLFNFISIIEVDAAINNASSCSQSDVQAAIDFANDGDTVKVPACNNGIWNSQVTIPNSKGIKLEGAGIDQTVISLNASNSMKFVIYTASGNSTTEVSDITFSGGSSSGNALVNVRGTGVFRLHHLKFEDNNIRVLWIGTKFTSNYGPFGVIDHSTFTATTMRTNVIWVENGAPSWTTPMSFGTADAVYIEDSTFDYTNYSSGKGMFDGGYGGRAVIRYNTISNADIKVHGYWSSLESFLQLEVYENTISNSDTTRHFFLRGGTGYIYNNTLTGSSVAFHLRNYRSISAGSTPCACDGTCSVDGNEETNGYPCNDQIGRGYNQTLVPYYEYNNTVNGSDADFIVSGSSQHIQENRDYYNDTPKPGYTPYTYPHPLTITNPSPNAPYLFPPQ